MNSDGHWQTSASKKRRHFCYTTLKFTNRCSRREQSPTDSPNFKTKKWRILFSIRERTGERGLNRESEVISDSTAIKCPLLPLQAGKMARYPRSERGNGHQQIAEGFIPARTFRQTDSTRKPSTAWALGETSRATRKRRAKVRLVRVR